VLVIRNWRSVLPLAGEGSGEGEAYLSRNRMVHRHELRSIRERPLDLDIRNHLGDAFHHVLALEQSRPVAHQLGNGFAVARPFEYAGRDIGYRFRVVELEP